MSKKQTVFNLLFLVVVFGLTMYLVFRGKDIGDIISTARGADARYLLLSIVRGAFYTGRIGDHLLYDENPWHQCENGTLCTVFLCRIFLQLHHTVCLRRTAYADFLYEEG